MGSFRRIRAGGFRGPREEYDQLEARPADPALCDGRHRRVQANDSIGLRVDPGSVVGLLGHNGAGKTTLVSQVVGLLRPDAGSIHVGSIDAVADPGAALTRSEERRVGKECRSRWSPYH